MTFWATTTRRSLLGFTLPLFWFSLCDRHVCRVWASLLPGKGVYSTPPLPGLSGVFFSVAKT